DQAAGGAAGRIAVVAAGAPAGYTAGRAAAHLRERPDRRGSGAVLSADRPDRVSRRTEPRADGTGHQPGADGVGDPGRRAPDFPGRADSRRSASHRSTAAGGPDRISEDDLLGVAGSVGRADRARADDGAASSAGAAGHGAD